jgi:hypothetical protein
MIVTFGRMSAKQAAIAIANETARIAWAIMVSRYARWLLAYPQASEQSTDDHTGINPLCPC